MDDLVKNYVLILYGKHLKRARPSQWDVDHELESVKFQVKDVAASSPIGFLLKHDVPSAATSLSWNLTDSISWSTLGGASTVVGDAVVVYWYRYSAQRSSPEAASALSPPIGWGGEDAHACRSGKAVSTLS